MTPSLLLSALIGAFYWNIRKSYKISKQIFGDRLLFPEEYRDIALYALGGMIAWGLVAKLTGRRISPLALAPAAIAGALAAFTFVDPWTRDTFTYMIWCWGLGLTAAAVAWELALPARMTLLARRRLPAKLRTTSRRWAPWAGLAALLAVQAAMAAWAYRYMGLKLLNMQVEAYDFANLQQSMWTLANLGTPKTTVMDYAGLEQFGWHWWAEHFTPIQFFLLPFYAPFQTLESLLVLQYVALLGAIVPLWLALRVQARSELLAFALTGAYVAHPLMAQAALNDFHYEMFFPAFFFGAYYFYAKRRPAGFIVLLLAAFSAKETLAAYVFFWGLALLLFDRDRRRWGALIAGLCVAYFLFAAQMVIPWHRDGQESRLIVERYRWMFAARGLPEFQSLGDVVKAALFYPQDVLRGLLADLRPRSFAILLAPFAALCLARPWTLLIFLPAALANILSGYDLQAQLRIYHALEFMPLAVVATASALVRPSVLPERIHRKRRSLSACFALALVIAAWGSYQSRSLYPGGGMHRWHPPFAHRTDERAAKIYDLLREVPPEPAVATCYMLCVPMSGREWLFHTDPPLEHAELFIAARGMMGAPVETIANAEEMMLAACERALTNGEWGLANPYEPELGLLWMKKGLPPPSAEQVQAILTDLTQP